MSRDAWGKRWHAEQDAREGIVDDGYENAPATRLVATNCVACGRPLVDAISVEAGMGPDCRSKHGHAGPEGATEEARTDVNKRVAQLARGVEATEAVGHLLIIRAHGFTKLADKLEERLCTVEIVDVEPPPGAGPQPVIAVTAPYSEAFTADVKLICWRRWDAANKRWLVAGDSFSRKRVWAFIRRHFPGTIGRGPQGLFPIEGA